MNVQIPKPLSGIPPLYKATLEATNKVELKNGVDQIVSVFHKNEDKVLKTIQRDLKAHVENLSDSASKSKFISSLEAYMDMVSVKTGAYVSSSVLRRDAKKIAGLRAQLVEEYNAQSTSELLFVDITVNAYFRLMSLSAIHGLLIEDNDGNIEYGNQQKINLIKAVGRHIEFANHQFVTALNSLRAFKQPPVNIRVQTKETYIAQNQQINKDA